MQFLVMNFEQRKEIWCIFATFVAGMVFPPYYYYLKTKF